MVYKAFQETIIDRLQNRLGPDYRLTVSKIPRNNGLFLDGLAVTPAGQTMAPVVYLNHYYERFLAGRSMDDLVEEITDIYRESAGLFQPGILSLNDFSQLKDKVTYRIISTKDNQLLLEDVVSFPFEDLSIVFYLLLQQSPTGQMSALIHKRHMKQWQTTPEELLALAETNTPRLLPPVLKPMADVMENIARTHIDQEYEPGMIDRIFPGHEAMPLYVLSNSTALNGACVMLYPDVLKNFAEQLDRDLVILPSSIHEVLLLPYDEDIRICDLAEMVTGINQNEVAVEDRLSDHVYLYSRAADAVALARDPGCADLL